MYSTIFRVSSEAYGSHSTWSPSFNKTIPTIDGTAPNNILPSISDIFADTVIAQFSKHETIVGAIRGCATVCHAKLKAPAFSATCETYQVPVNYTQPISEKEISKIITEAQAPPLDKEGFLVSTSLVEGVNETVNLVTGWNSIHDCIGVFNYRVCTLTSAVGEYSVTVKGDTATLDDAAHPRILALANNTLADHSSPLELPGSLSTFASLVNFMFGRWESFAAFYNYQGQTQKVVYAENIMDSYIVDRNQGNGACDSFLDPYEDVMKDLNRFMVYTGARATGKDALFLETHMDPGWPINTTTVGTVVGDHNVYKSEYRFFIAAAIVELACILLIAPTYWGWWRLGRPCSFSPLEVAKVCLFT